MLFASALLLSSASVDCAAFASRLHEPVRISVTPLSASQIARADAIRSSSSGRDASWIGELLYKGRGVEIRSSDPRFSAIAVDRTQGFRHPCGYTAFGPSGWSATDADLDRWTIRFETQPGEAPPGALQAASKGVVPVLTGATPGPTWPVSAASGSFYLGVMYPAGKEGESIIVAFPERSGAVPARVLARLRMKVQGFTITPSLHTPENFLNLEERTTNGAIRRVVLELDDASKERLARELSN